MMKHEQLSPPVITCTEGALAGIASNGVDAFFDIPYAAALNQSRRFSLPGEPAPWQGVRDATRPGPVFPQTRSRLTAVMGTTPGFANQSESAFALNVWRPARTCATSDGLPVLVWIHGGGWLTGGAPLAWYHGDRLAASGRVVVVSVNYRLGALGNLYLPGQTAGSMALHDLAAALRWIRKNIGNFGGDPSRVTVCGQSAGAWYTAALTRSPLGTGLFSQAVLLSLPGSIAPHEPEQAAAFAHSFCELLEIPPTLDALRQLSVDRILEGQGLFARAHPVFADIPPTFLPLVSDALPANLSEIDESQASRMRFLLGSLPEEMGAFFSHDDSVLNASDASTLQRLAVFGERNEMRFPKEGRDGSGTDNYARLLHAVSDEIFRAPTQKLADGIANHGGTCYVYEFMLRSRMPRTGACHCFELPYLFDTFDAWSNAPMLDGLDVEAARRVSADFQESILCFVAGGDPNCGRLPNWPRYTSRDRSAMHFDTTPVVGTFDVSVTTIHS